MTLFDHLAESIAKLNATRWVICLSGGADSVALLHAFKLQFPEQHLIAIHVNHHIAADANQWQQLCQTYCDSLGVELIVKHCQFDDPKAVNENAAREARYSLIEQCVSEGDCVLTAHHANDQLETFLMRIWRGDGLRGLMSIPVQRKFAGGATMFRPLLDVSRDRIESYCQFHNLPFVSDPANSDDRFDRSRVRKTLVPLLETVLPKFGHRAEATRKKLETSYGTLSELLAVVGKSHIGTSRYGAWWTPIQALSNQSDWLHFWLTEILGLRFRASVFDTLLKALSFDDDQRFELGHPDGSFYYYDGKVWFVPNASLPTEQRFDARDFSWGSDEYTVQPAVLGRGFRQGDYTIRPVSPGTTLVPAGRRGRRKLKKLYQELRVPWFVRQRLPGVFDGDELVAVADLVVNDNYAVLADEVGVVLTYKEIE